MHTARILDIVLVAALLAPHESSAQDAGTTTTTTSSTMQITISPVVARFLPDGGPAPVRPQAQNPNDINYKDCASDIILQFTLTEVGFPTSPPDQLEIWAGNSCATPAAGGTAGSFCWLLAPRALPAATQTVNLYARDITQYLDQALSVIPNDGNPPTTLPDLSACRTQQSPGQVPMNLYFMFVEGNGTVDYSMAYPLNVDLVGPAAPTGVSAGIGDGLLLLNWTPPVDSTIQGFNIYVQDQGPSGVGASSEAGASTLATPYYCRASSDSGVYALVSDAGSLAGETDAGLEALGCYRGGTRDAFDAGGPGAAVCQSSVLVDTFILNGAASTSDAGTGVATIVNGNDASAVVTGTLGISELDGAISGGDSTSSSGQVSGLINGHQYAVAVAAYDEDGNVGALSNLACDTPEPIVDFWNLYGSAGGQAGGGCAIDAGKSTVPGVWLLAGLGVVGVVVRRRKARPRETRRDAGG